MDDKPDSVVNGHSSTSTVASKLLHATRSHSLGVDVCIKQTENCLRLHAVGFTKAMLVAKHAVRSYRTFSPLPVNTEVFHRRSNSLWHCALTCNQRSVDVIHHRYLPCPDFPRVSNESRPATVCPRAYCTPSSTLRTWLRRNQISLHG